MVMIYGNTWSGDSTRDVFTKKVLKKLFAVSPFLFGKMILTGESDPYQLNTGSLVFLTNIKTVLAIMKLVCTKYMFGHSNV